MASILSKVARAAFATRASPSAVGGFAGGGRPAAAIGVSPAGGPKLEEEEKATPKLEEEEKATPKSEVAPHAATIRRPPLHVDDNVLKSKGAMWAFYEYWCKYFGLKRDRSEMGRRFRTFSASARFVHKSYTSGSPVKYGMTKYADTSEKEMFPGLARRTDK